MSLRGGVLPPKQSPVNFAIASPLRSSHVCLRSAGNDINHFSVEHSLCILQIGTEQFDI